MLNDILFAFFFGMPAIAAISISSGFTNALARKIVFWGGCLFTALAAIILIPMLLCDGAIITTYKNCVGGDALARLFSGAQPLITDAAYFYVLVGPALAIIAALLEWSSKRSSARI